MNNKINTFQTIRKRKNSGHSRRDVKYSTQNSLSRRTNKRSKNSVALRQESFQSISDGEDDLEDNNLILCETLLKKPSNLSVFSKNKKNLKKWASIKDTKNMFNNYQYDKRHILASGKYYEVINGVNKHNGKAKLIKIIDCKFFGGFNQAIKKI